MKSKINGCRTFKINENTKEVEDILFFYPETYLKKINNEYTSLNENEIICSFIIKEKLGEGAFGAVHLGINKQTGEKVAIKILEKYKIRKFEDKIRIEREIEILKKVKHPNIVQLYSVIEAEKQIFLIMEFIKGIELFQYIFLNKKLSEEESCFYFLQIISGIEYLHNLKIAHRDIKSENMIIEHNTKNLKIFDFGLSNTYGDKPNGMLSTACGSPCYTAPEMLNGKMYKGGGVDIWSLGVVLFSMVCGFLPFHGESNKETYLKIIEGKYSVPAFVSKMGSELIHNILNTNPKKRINISKIKKHYWVKLYSNGLNNEGKSLFNVGLISDKYVIPIDEDIIDLMEQSFKIPKIKTRIEVLSNNSNEYTTLYYLLVKRKINSGKKSVADFKGDLFLKYLEDKNNLMSHYKNDINNVIEARKMGVLLEQDKIYDNNNKNKNNDNNFFHTESNVKSQDNLFRFNFKHDFFHKTINITSFNSSSNLKNNFNKQTMMTNNNSNNNILNVHHTKKIKNEINIIIENTNESNAKKIINKSGAKTARNKANLHLKPFNKKNNKTKTILQNKSEINGDKDSNIINTKNNNSSLSRINSNSINKSHRPMHSYKTMKIINVKKNNKDKILYNNTYRNSQRHFIQKTASKTMKALKYSHDEIEEEKYSKIIIEELQHEQRNNHIIIEEDNDIKIKRKYHSNCVEKNEKNNTNQIRNDDSKKLIIKYKETISPSIEAKNTINNNNTENIMKLNTFKTLESISLQTINQEKYDLSNNYSVKNILELNCKNIFSEKEEDKSNNNNINENLSSHKKKIFLKKDKKSSKLLKNVNTPKINSKKDLRIDNENKRNNKKNINPIKKNIIEKNKNNNEIKTHRLHYIYKKKNNTKNSNNNNNDSNDYLTKKNLGHNLTENRKLEKN